MDFSNISPTELNSCSPIVELENIDVCGKIKTIFMVDNLIRIVILEPSLEVTLLDDNKPDIHGYLIVPIDHRGVFSTNTSYLRSTDFKLNLTRQFPEVVDTNPNNFDR